LKDDVDSYLPPEIEIPIEKPFVPGPTVCPFQGDSYQFPLAESAAASLVLAVVTRLCASEVSSRMYNIDMSTKKKTHTPPFFQIGPLRPVDQPFEILTILALGDSFHPMAFLLKGEIFFHILTPFLGLLLPTGQDFP